MQAITPELAAILKAKFMAGASGFRGKVICGGVSYYPTQMDVDHSLQTMADAFTATFTNEDGEIGLAADAFPDNALFTAWAWYGDPGNVIQVFEGFIDKISEHRDPKTVTILGRDWMKPLLVQDIATIAPQAAGEAGAIRNTSNFVYLNSEVDFIVRKLLDKAGYPADRRLIQPTNFQVTEFLGQDGMSYADAIGQLADIVAFNAFADELGYFHFQPDGLADSTTDSPPTPVYTFRSGEDITALDPQRDDYDLKTRVKATGPYTSLQDSWTELWHNNVIKNPTGVWHEAGDATHLNVADGPLRKIYRIVQGAGGAIVSSRDLHTVITYLNGLSGDPSSALYYWTLDTPWIAGGAPTNNKVRKHLKSDNSVVTTYSLPNQQWTDMKVGTTAIWLTNFSTDKVHAYSKTTGLEIAAYSVPGHVNPIGVAIDGSDLYLSFYAEATMLQVTTAAPTVVVRTLKFSGTKSLGGEIDTDTHTELYACSGGLSLVYKYTLKVPVTNDVSVELVNDALELALGVELTTGREIRRLRVDLPIVISHAQAAEAAARRLDKLDQFRNVMDVGIIGNPALQKGDMVRIEDPVTSVANDFQVDTYRSSLNGDTYLGTLALVPWSSSYAGPGDVIPPDSDFPTPVDVDEQFGATSSVGSGVTHNVPYPTNMQNGELMVAFLGSSPTSGNTPAITMPGALTVIGGAGSYSAWFSGRVAYRFWDGTEGSTFAVTQDQPGQIMYRCYRIINAHPTAPPEHSAVGYGTTFDPTIAQVTPSWGSAKNLYIATLAYGEAYPIMSYPVSYPDGRGQTFAGAFGSIVGAYLKEQSDISPPGDGINNLWTFGHIVHHLNSAVAVRPV